MLVKMPIENYKLYWCRFRH